MRLIILLIATTMFCSCAQKVMLDRPNSVLIEEGEQFLADGKYSKAVNNFRAVILNADNPEMSMRVQLLLADAYYQDKEYIDAVAAYEVYNEMYRRTADTPFVLYRLGMSYSKLSKHPRRDQTFTLDAFTYFEQLKAVYPTEFVEYGAMEELQKMRNKLAEAEYQVAKYYWRVSEYASIVLRCGTLLETFPDSPRVEETRVLLIRAYIKQKDAAAAQEQLQVLKNEYPENRKIASLTRNIEKMK